MHRTCVLVVVPFLLVVVCLRESVAQQSFPLVCRGGGRMTMRSHAGNVQHTFNILGLFFEKGTRGTTPGNFLRLAPGQCSWVDRGMRNGEPDILQQEVGPGVNSQPWFNVLKTSNGCWIFEVFNTNQGVMKVTSNRPCRSID